MRFRAPEHVARFCAEIEYMKARWPAELAHDPFFNPNFSDDKWPHYAAPPRVALPWLTADDEPRSGQRCDRITLDLLRRRVLMAT